MTQNYDAIVVGSGQGGTPLAINLAEEGWETALIEKDEIGGTCINRGCTPTKTLVASARAAHVANTGDRLGVEGSATVNFDKIMDRKNKIVSNFRGGKEKQLDSNNLDLYRNEARFVDNAMLEVGNERITSDRIVLNVGLRPVVPPIDGLDEADYLTSRELLDLDDCPGSLIVVGGGYVGCEFAQMFQRFGSDVTILQGGSALLDREDPEISEAVQSVFERENITVETDSRVTSVREENGTVVVEDDENKYRAEEVLLAVGRRPNTDQLNLEATNLEPGERGFLDVDDHFRTDHDAIWAIGDVTGNAPFTNVSYHDNQILYEDWVEGGSNRSRPSERNVTHAVFIDPPVAGVGLNEREAKQQDIDYEVASTPMSHVARGIEVGETDGLLKVLADPDNGRILGATMIGIRADELVHVFTSLMDSGASYEVLEDMVCAHPAVAEALPLLVRKLETN